MPVPGDVDPALAGALGIAGLAGWLPVAVRAPVQEGETVLVLGATGTVGLVAMQGARLLGAGRVVAAGRRPEALERARRLGADAVVSLDEDDLAAALREACGGDGPSLVVDPLWGEPVVAAARAAAPRRADRQHRPVGRGDRAAAVGGRPRQAAQRARLLELRDAARVMNREYLRLVEHARRASSRSRS